MSVVSMLGGILLAVLSAISLSAGNILQSRGVARASTLRPSHSPIVALLMTPLWLWGTLMFGVAILLQMASLVFAPLMLVQPIGVLALIVSVFINARIDKAQPSPAVLKAVSITFVGVVIYVVVASQVTSQSAITDTKLIAVLVSLGAAIVLAAILWLTNRTGAHRAPVLYVLLGGVFSAFVATLGKTVILRIQALFDGHHFEIDRIGLLTIFCVVGIVVASGLSIYFVQTAYTCNHSDVVVAGLTVVDPAIAVLIGILILREASSAPAWSLVVIAIAGAVAIYGVIRLAREETIEEGKPAADTRQSS